MSKSRHSFQIYLGQIQMVEVGPAAASGRSVLLKKIFFMAVSNLSNLSVLYQMV